MCSGNVTVTVPGSTTAPLVIPVTFNVSSSALLSVSVPAINITAVAGAAAMTQTVSVTSTNNTGAGILSHCDDESGGVELAFGDAQFRQHAQ